MMELLFATSNEHKAKAVQLILGWPVQHIKLDLAEIQALDVKEVIGQKAQEAYRLIGQPVLVEDTSLSIHAWHGLPGALIRWFLETVGNEGICKMLEGYTQREASAETWIGYFDGATVKVFSGMIEGHIASQPRGQRGFGWDPIFVPHGWDKSLAEFSGEEEGFVSMRTQAVLKLRAFLAEQARKQA